MNAHHNRPPRIQISMAETQQELWGEMQDPDLDPWFLPDDVQLYMGSQSTAGDTFHPVTGDQSHLSAHMVSLVNNPQSDNHVVIESHDHLGS